jgi:predicted small lipoprotein YifL
MPIALKVLAMTVVCAALVSGCGKKGVLEAPSAEAKEEKTGDKKDGEKKDKVTYTVGKEKENKSSQYPTGEHRPFILDGLLR